jgi:hypothetical protein
MSRFKKRVEKWNTKFHISNPCPSWKWTGFGGKLEGSINMDVARWQAEGTRGRWSFGRIQYINTFFVLKAKLTNKNEEESKSFFTWDTLGQLAIR